MTLDNAIDHLILNLNIMKYDIETARKSHKRISLNSINLNAALGHMNDMIERTNVFSDGICKDSEYPSFKILNKNCSRIKIV